MTAARMSKMWTPQRSVEFAPNVIATETDPGPVTSNVLDNYAESRVTTYSAMEGLVPFVIAAHGGNPYAMLVPPAIIQDIWP